jgi:hypothetical protein
MLSGYKVEVHRRSGGYSSTPFPTLGPARDFFELHKNNNVDLVELKEWQPDYKKDKSDRPGAWVVIEQYVTDGAI